MSLYQDILNSTTKFFTTSIAGLISIFTPTYVPLLALTGITVVNTLYAVQVNRKYSKLKTGLIELKKMFYRIRDTIVAVCGAYTIQTYIITSIDLHAVEFISGAIALIEFWTLIEHMSEIHPNWAVWKLVERLIKSKSKQILDVDVSDILEKDGNKD